jgi:CRP-like cAMP-binding protein
MQIDLDLLFTWGAIAKKYKKNDMIFDENDTAHYYYQIMEGSVRLYNSNDDGKEFTQDLLLTGDSFGDSSLLIDKGYPSKAVSLKESTIIKLTKEKFFNILEEYPYLQKQFMISMAQKIHAKLETSKEIINQKPEFRIVAFLNTFKRKTVSADRVLVPYTRQEIANFTGLRVETVIRVCTRMNNNNKVKIINHKLYY